MTPIIIKVEERTFEKIFLWFAGNNIYMNTKTLITLLVCLHMDFILVEGRANKTRSGQPRQTRWCKQ